MIEVIKDNGIYMEHPDGGHCNLMGMTDDCYGCAMYGGGLTEECADRVYELKRAIAWNLEIPFCYLFDMDDTSKELSHNDSQWKKFINKLISDKPWRIFKGCYLYKGYNIRNVYVQTKKKYGWKVVDIYDKTLAEKDTMKECIKFVDELYERR